MASPSGVQVIGLRDKIRDLEKMGAEVADLKAAMGRIAESVKPIYADGIPRQSGALAESLRASRTKGRAALRVGSARVPYAAAINYGWGPGAIGYKHGRRSNPLLRGSYKGSDFIARGDVQAAPRARSMLDAELSALISRLNLD